MPEQTRRREGTGASVDIQENTPVGASVETSEVFLAEHEGRIVKSVDKDVVSEDGNPVTTTHTRPGTIVMYKPTQSQGYVPRTVSVSALRLLLRQGWKEHCGDCGKAHLDKEGKHSSDPNLCSAREPVAVRICPVCQKRIYDNMRFDEAATETDDVNVIRDNAYLKGSSGAERTKLLLDLHIWVRHPVRAQMMAIPPLPAALREMVEEKRPA